ncbi:hypothetical protein C5Z26_05550 [Lactobacillus sp. CBA3606]|uniref:hypothetical protein n=1 Tax=Lactobacillus sp. CBA3606 TaxID=2099789 RepID=UPI000CFBF9FD|nr:hypothetical protein [Lactobacillus sp. CBA3606]AVK63603.1 hypothetical protein C5Z26_05550 [Lactobacillus sp. CBA3606]
MLTTLKAKKAVIVKRTIIGAGALTYQIKLTFDTRQAAPYTVSVTACTLLGQTSISHQSFTELSPAKLVFQHYFANLTHK